MTVFEPRIVWGDIFPRKERDSVSAKWGVVVGNMGSGKTTLVKFLVLSYGRGVFYRLDSLEEFLDFLDRRCDGHYEDLLLLLDDVSFLLFGVTKDTREFLSRFFRIRHYCSRSRRIFTFFVVHYSKSINRFVRGAHLKILTSIDPVEIKPLGELFPEHVLIDYYEYYIENYQDRYVVLLSTPRRIEIVDATLSSELVQKIKSLPDFFFIESFS